MGKTRSSPVVHAKNKILKIKQFSLGTATAIFLSQTNMSTFKDARTVLLESYLDGVIDDDKFVPNDCYKICRIYVKISGRTKIDVFGYNNKDFSQTFSSVSQFADM